MTPLRIGIIGLDTSHVTAFTDILNNSDAPHHVPGGKVVAAFPGGSPDWDLSHGRVKGFTDELVSKHGVQILASPEAVAEAVDLVLLESVDGRVHLEQFKRTLKFKRPTFIDKPLAIQLDEAKEIVRLAADAGIPMFSSSSLRFSDLFVAAMADPSSGPVVGIDIFGPLSFQPTQPGWFWYGIHMVDQMVTAMGPGCRRLRVVANEKNDMLTAEWKDGRMGTIRGSRYERSNFGCTLHYNKAYKMIDSSGNPRPVYVCLVSKIMATLPFGKVAVPADQMLEVIAILEAANRSRETGEWVNL